MDIWHDPLFLAALKKGGAGGTASGDIVSFYTPKAAPLRALTVGIDPVQDLHGYDSPWPAGGGKNKLVPAVPGGSITWNDVTLSVQNGELYLNGKPTTSGGRTSLRTSNFTLPAGTYIISCITTQFVLHDTSDNIIANTLGTASFTLTEDTSVYAGFNVIANTQYSGVLKAQIELGSTATPYAPYSNECPISGWSAANLWRTGRNLKNLEFSQENSKNIITNVFALKAGTYTLSMNYSGTPTWGVYLRNGQTVSSPVIMQAYNVTTLTFTLDKNYSELCVSMYYVNGISVSEVTDIQLELGSTPTPYAPYTGTTIPITWSEAGTVYGGEVDVLNGVLTVTHAEVDLGTLDWSAWGTVEGLYGANISDMKAPTTAEERKTEIICSMYPVATTATMNNNFTDKSCARYQQSVFLRDTGYATADALTAALDGVQFVYPLATPLTYTLTPAQLDTLAGQQNVVWGDCGPIDLEYVCDNGVEGGKLALLLRNKPELLIAMRKGAPASELLLAMGGRGDSKPSITPLKPVEEKKDEDEEAVRK